MQYEAVQVRQEAVAGCFTPVHTSHHTTSPAAVAVVKGLVLPPLGFCSSEKLLDAGIGSPAAP